MTRNEKILSCIDPVNQIGLEIGALCRPLIPPGTGRIRYVDHCSTEELKAKYASDPDVDVASIVDVSFVWKGQPFAEIVGNERFDYVVASHVIEHAPDMLNWLRELAAALKPGGILALIIPDKRWCFDCRRENTSLGSYIQAFLEERRRPNLGQVVDHIANAAEFNTADLWAGRASLAALKYRHTIDHFDEQTLLAQHSGIINENLYMDVHCSVFTPYSFIEILRQLAIMNLLDYRVVRFYDTPRDDVEFIVALEKLSDDLSVAERKSLITKSLPDLMPPLLPGEIMRMEQEFEEKRSVYAKEISGLCAERDAVAAEKNRLSDELSQAEQRLQHSQDECALLLHENRALCAEKNRLSDELSQAEQRLQHSRDECALLLHENRALRASTSWRITAPLRALKHLLHRIAALRQKKEVIGER